MFIDKIKRVLGIFEMPEKNDEEKIYDISTFEKKQDVQEDKQTDAFAINKESNDGVIIDSDSTELSEAFEKLFEDNYIFKEFQELNEAKEKNNYNSTNTPEESIGSTIAQNEEVVALPNTEITDIKKDIYKATEAVNIIGKEDIGNDFNSGSLLNNTVNKEGGTIKLEILTEDIVAKMDDYFKRSIDNLLNEVKPQIIENIKIVLPEIAEKLIRIEIEKVKNIGEQDSYYKEDTKNEDI